MSYPCVILNSYRDKEIGDQPESRLRDQEEHFPIPTDITSRCPQDPGIDPIIRWFVVLVDLCQPYTQTGMKVAREDPNELKTTFPPLTGKRVAMGDVFTSCNWVLRDGSAPGFIHSFV
jgi:hypothetical protein